MAFRLAGGFTARCRLLERSSLCGGARRGLTAAVGSKSSKGSPAAQRARADPELRRFDIGGFETENGGFLPEGAVLAYRVHGPPVGRSSGVILHPTSFDAVHDELGYQIGPGRTLDTSRYTVVVPNLLGNGVSFSPSNAPADGKPLRFTVGDNVRIQKAMLQQNLGVACDSSSPLALVYGYSMGALQAYEWAVAFPDAVERVAAVCGAARCSEINRIFLASLEAALKADKNWDGETQSFAGHPAGGLRAFAAIYAGWGVGSEYYEERAYEAAGFRSAGDFLERSYVPAFAGCNADDLLSQIYTWRTADVARHHGGDLAKAFSRIKARKVMVMPCDTDRYFTLRASEHEVALLGEQRGILRPIRSTAGHRAGDPHRPELAAELSFLRRNVHELLMSDS